MCKLFKLIINYFKREPIVIKNINDLAKFVPEGREQVYTPFPPPHSSAHSPLTNGAVKILESNNGGEITVNETTGPKPDRVAGIRATTSADWKVSRLKIIKKP